MAVHFVRDIETDDEGEIVIERGDFKLATTERTALQLTNWVVLTELADYTPFPNFGANLGEYVGYPNNSRTHRLMRQSIKEGIRIQGQYGDKDVRIAVEPIAEEEAGVLVEVLGDFYLEPDEITMGKVLLAFRYPYPNGQLVKADLGVD